MATSNTEDAPQEVSLPAAEHEVVKEAIQDWDDLNKDYMQLEVSLSLPFKYFFNGTEHISDGPNFGCH